MNIQGILCSILCIGQFTLKIDNGQKLSGGGVGASCVGVDIADRKVVDLSVTVRNINPTMLKYFPLELLKLRYKCVVKQLGIQRSRKAGRSKS